MTIVYITQSEAEYLAALCDGLSSIQVEGLSGYVEP